MKPLAMFSACLWGRLPSYGRGLLLYSDGATAAATAKEKMEAKRMNFMLG